MTMTVASFWKGLKAAGDWMIEVGDGDKLIAVLKAASTGAFRTGLFGEAFENAFADEAKRRNYRVKNVSAKKLQHDVEVEGYRVQCKFIGTTTRSIQPYGKRANSDGRHAYRLTEFDVLALSVGTIDAQNALIIPVHELANDGEFISRRVEHYYFDFRGRWDVFDNPHANFSRRLF